MDIPLTLIVGVDYGTTFTGVSYAPSDTTNISEIRVINEWGGGLLKNQEIPKVPSRVAYNENGSVCGWGFNIEPGKQSYGWTKLLLDRNTDTTIFDDPQLRNFVDAGLLTIPRGMTATKVVTDYLTEVYQHTMKILEIEMSASILKVTAIKFWFTVPANWSDEARHATRAAAKAAGFGSRQGDNLNMIKEPAAAALACIKQFTAREHNGLAQPDTCVLVVDCGGGTVDLTSFVVKSNNARVNLEQACINAGGKCGSTAIDRNFHQWMEARFGDAYTAVDTQKKGVGSKLVQEFESVKRHFGASNVRREYRLPLKLSAPASDYYDDDDFEIILPNTDVRALFEPVVTTIISLVHQQVQASVKETSLPVKTIALVGGFGESPYLYTRIKAWCSQDINLVCPKDAWSAIVRGAALRGIDGPMITKEKCSLHYGTDVARIFREGIDNEEEAWMDRWSHEKFSTDNMEWMWKRGEDIRAGSSHSKEFNWTLGARGDPLFMEIDLYSSDASVAPRKKTDPSVRRVGTVVVKLKRASLKFYQAKINREGRSRRKVYHIDFELKSTMGDAFGLMHFEVVSKGQIVGKATLRFKNDV